MILIIIVVLVLLFAGGGYYGAGRYGNGSWSPLVVVLVVLLALWMLGVIHV